MQNSNDSWKITLINQQGSLDITNLLSEYIPAGNIKTESITTLLKENELKVGNYSECIIRVSNKSNKNWRDLYLNLSWYFSINLSPDKVSELPISIVYYINSYVNTNYWVLVYFQLLDLKRSKILSQTGTSLSIVFSGDEVNQTFIREKVSKLFCGFNNVKVDCTHENNYEFPGIHKVWSLSQNTSEGLVLYFHTKGLSHLKLGWFKSHRLSTERVLFSKVIKEWKENLEWLSRIDSVNKLGLQTGGKGWIWYNFWWARYSYIRQLEEPCITTDRYYYEHWLARKAFNSELSVRRPSIDQYPNSFGDCLSIFSFPELSVTNLGFIFQPKSYESRLAFLSRWRLQYLRLKLHLKRKH